MKTKVKFITSDGIGFEDDSELTSSHLQECCENHYLDFSHLTMDDFQGLEFDLSSDGFFKPVEDYGIQLIPVQGHSINVPGYGSNNGHYSHKLILVLTTRLDNDKLRTQKEYDITSCQTVSG